MHTGKLSFLTDPKCDETTLTGQKYTFQIFRNKYDIHIISLLQLGRVPVPLPDIKSHTTVNNCHTIKKIDQNERNI